MFFAALSLNDVIDIINNALRGLFAVLCQAIYPLIAGLYQLFTDMGLLFYSDNFAIIYKKISLVIGVFMVFRVTFWLIELLVNPDKISDKEKAPGEIIKRVLLSVVLLAITPRIFKLAFDLQYEVVSKNIIGQIINTSSEDIDIGSSGKLMAAKLFVNFYTINVSEDGKVDEDCQINTGEKGKEENGAMYIELKDKGTLKKLTNKCLTAKFDGNDKDSEYKIDFNGIFAVGAGSVVAWMILMYCISVGARYVQLIFLQVIAPIPIMCYLAPGKDNMFSKWVKQCTTTYLDLFIRIAIINFVMLLSNMVLSNNSSFLSEITSVSDNGWIQVFLVLGLLTFAKKAPELIQELLPKSVTKASGDFGLSLKKRSENMLGGKFAYGALKRAPGYVAGGVTGAAVGLGMGIAGGKGVGSRLAGGLSGAARGFATGSKKGNVFKNLSEVKKNQAAQNNKLQQWRIDAGKGEDEPNKIGDYFSRKSDAAKKAMGFETRAQERKRDTEFANKAADSYKGSMDYGNKKALEKDRSLRAFGKTDTIAELDANRKQAAAAYQNNSVEKLMSTSEGEVTLKNFARNQYLQRVKEQRMARGETETQADAWINSHKDYVERNFNTTFDNLSDSDKHSLAEQTMDSLRRASIDAEKEFGDYEKKAGFDYLVEEYSKGVQNVVNDFDVINKFLQSHPDIAEKYAQECKLDAKDTEELKKGFDAEKLNDLRMRASTGNQDDIEKYEKYFKAFDSFKTLKAQYAAENASKEAQREKANDTYNGSK